MKQKKVDPKHSGIPNICFSLTEGDDKREIDFKKQRLSRGFDDSETWSLKDTMALFILPRLKEYRKIIDGFILNHDNFYEKIDTAIRAFELVIKDNESFMTDDEFKEYEIGMQNFCDIYLGLWW